MASFFPNEPLESRELEDSNNLSYPLTDEELCSEATFLTYNSELFEEYYTKSDNFQNSLGEIPGTPVQVKSSLRNKIKESQKALSLLRQIHEVTKNPSQLIEEKNAVMNNSKEIKEIPLKNENKTSNVPFFILNQKRL